MQKKILQYFFIHQNVKKKNNKNAPKNVQKTVKVNKVFMLCHIGQVGPGG
jgi:hypothetical protein